jgi:HSP20 family protein
MQEVNQALSEVKELYQRILGRPAPELQPTSFVAFPPGVDPLNHALHEVQYLKQLSEQIAMAPRPVTWVPLADCYASKDTFVVRLEVPGIDRKDLKVFLTGGECLVRGERKSPEWVKELRPLMVEQSWGPFERRFALPEGCNAEKVSARCENGVLEVRISVEEHEVRKETKVEVA